MVPYAFVWIERLVYIPEPRFSQHACYPGGAATVSAAEKDGVAKRKVP